MLRRWVWVKIMDQGDRLSADRGMYPRKSRHLTVILCPGSKTVSGPRRAKRHLPTQGEAFSQPPLVESAWLRLLFRRHAERWPIGTRWRGHCSWWTTSQVDSPGVEFTIPKTQILGDPTNLSGSMTQNDSNRNPLRSGRYSNWLSMITIWISYINIYERIHYQYHPLSSITWHLLLDIYYLTSIPINIYKLSRLPPMLPSICRVVARRRESEHLYHAASLRWGRPMRHSWNLVWLLGESGFYRLKFHYNAKKCRCYSHWQSIPRDR